MAKSKTSKKVSQDEDLSIFTEIGEEFGGDVLSNIEETSFFIDTGSLAVNYILSKRFIHGGIPGKKITEVYGPSASGKTFIASNVIYGTQKLGGIPVLLDCENANNSDFMQQTSHVDPRRVLRFTPQSLEQAFNKILNVAKKVREKRPYEIPLVFVYDSISVSPCERELNETKLPENYTAAMWKKLVGRKEQPGERARICGNELRKLQAKLEELNITLLIINQTREKIGVLYGCASGRTKVLLADGSWVKIAKIVNQKLSVEVMSINPKTGEVSPRKVIDWHKNGKVEDGNKFLKFRFTREFDNGNGVMNMTPNHDIYISDHDGGIAKTAAGNLQVGDRVVTIRPEWLDHDHWQLVYGSVLGDGSVRRIENSRSTACLRFGHGIKQKGYLIYKRGMLGDRAGKISYRENSVTSDSRSLAELERMSHYRESYLIPEEIVEKLDPLGLAIWYMDGGTYGGSHARHGSGKSTIYATKWNNREAMLRAFDRFGLECRITDKGYVFDADNTLKLHRLIARYCPPCMWYKLHDSCHHLFDFSAPAPTMRWNKSVGIITSISDFDHTRFVGDDEKYDISVEGNHTYIVGGCLVSNSPETTAGGGKALPFYASCRFRTSTKKKIDNKRLGTFAGVNMKVANVKNRSCSPFIESEGIQLYFDTGINPIAGLLSLMIQSERIVPVPKKGWGVVAKYLPEGKDEYTFKATKEANTVPLQVFLDCPALLDAKDKAELVAYLAPSMNAVVNSSNADFIEKSIAFDVEGNPLDEDSDLMSEISEIEEAAEEEEEEVA